MKKLFFVTFLICWIIGFSQDRPNILWLTCEDMTFDYLSVYGNQTIQTPNLDAFAENGILFNNAYSNGPQCSPARTTIITGIYSPALSAEYHRRDVTYPTEFLWPSKLREAGYWTSNKGKTDYNIKNEGALEDIIWSNDNATFENAPSDKPFFSVQNFYTTHMSRITNSRDFNSRNNRTVSPDEVTPPPYLPNTVEMDTLRDDLAWYYDAVKQLDNWFGNRLAALEESGRADNTIIFFYSDHGGSMPGSKGYLRQEGVKVPMMVYFPEKWKHLAPDHADGVNNDIVQFVDLAPTVLTLVGLPKMDHMQGRVFCGTEEQKEPSPNYTFLYKANQGNVFIPARAVTDGKWKLIWNYNTFWPSGSRQGFQWQMPGYREWENAYRSENTTPWSDIQKYHWESMVPFELYDLETDPEEIYNLANEASHTSKLEELKAVIQNQIRSVKDLGFNPPSLRDTARTTTYYELTQTGAIDLNAIYQAAELASVAEVSDTTQLKEMLSNPNPTIRYWATVGYVRLAYQDQIARTPVELKRLLDRTQEAIHTQMMAATAMIEVGEYCEGVAFMKKNMSPQLAHYASYLTNPGIMAKILYDTYQANSGNFEYRSALINTGVMPYRYLIDPGSNVQLDESKLAQSDILDDCPETNESCGSAIPETFEGELSDAWSIEGQVAINNGQLEMNLDTTIPRFTYTFDPLAEKSVISFDFVSSRNWFKSYAEFIDSEGNTIAAIAFGDDGSKNIQIVTDSQGITSGNPTLGESLLGRDFVKLVVYEIKLTFDLSNNTYSIQVGGEETATVEDIPMLQSSSDINSFRFSMFSMFNGNGLNWIDNFEIDPDPIDLIDYQNSFTAIESALFSSSLGDEPNQYPEEIWDFLYNYFNTLKSNPCFDDQSEANLVTSENWENLQIFLNSKNPQPAESVKISGENLVDIESTFDFNATVLPENTTNKSIGWSVRNVTGSATIDSEGVFTPITAGSVEVIGSAQDGSGMADTLDVTIDILVSTLNIIADQEMIIGTSQTLNVEILPEDATNKEIDWSSSNPSIATISEQGVLTANDIGEVTITATSFDRSSTEESISVTISPVLVTQILITGLSQMNVGDTQQLSAEAFPENATDKTYVWSTSDENIANIDEEGNLLAINTGSLVVKATAQDGSEVESEFEITISKVLSVKSEQQVSLFPNPLKDELNIFVNQPSKITIITLDGRVVSTGQVSSGKSTSSVKKLSNGTYIVAIKNEESSFKERIIINR